MRVNIAPREIAYVERDPDLLVLTLPPAEEMIARGLRFVVHGTHSEILPLHKTRGVWLLREVLD
jgi:hypothetical protein